jgi:hypothetical protein
MKACSLGKKCVQIRPPRKFTARDVERITKAAIDSGVDWRDIAIKILGVLGIVGAGYSVCKLASSLNRILSMTAFIKDISIVLASATGLKVLLEYLLRSPLSKVPYLNWVIAALAILLVFIEKVSARLDLIITDIATIRLVSDKMTELCQYVNTNNYVKSDVERATEELNKTLIERFIDIFK